MTLTHCLMCARIRTCIHSPASTRILVGKWTTRNHLSLFIGCKGRLYPVGLSFGANGCIFAEVSDIVYRNHRWRLNLTSWCTDTIMESIVAVLKARIFIGQLTHIYNQVSFWVDNVVCDENIRRLLTLTLRHIYNSPWCRHSSFPYLVFGAFSLTDNS